MYLSEQNQEKSFISKIKISKIKPKKLINLSLNLKILKIILRRLVNHIVINI